MTRVHDEIVIDRDDLKELKAVYEEHKDDQNAVFTWRGNDFLVGYAKHLINHLETKLGEV